MIVASILVCHKKKNLVCSNQFADAFNVEDSEISFNDKILDLFKLKAFAENQNECSSNNGICLC